MWHKATLIVSFMILLNVGISLESTDGSTNSDLDGKRLYDMGKSLNYPLLKLLGRTFEALEEEIAKDTDNKTSFLFNKICRLHVCTEWSTWSKCSAVSLEQYGAQTRSRQCGTNDKSICANNAQGKNETDVRICEGICPNNYTVTENGFCIGFYETGMNITDAKSFCKRDEGYLVNIDSEMKASDINKLLEDAKAYHHYIIDGQRSLPNGEWRYDYGHASGYSSWISGEPDSTDDCKHYYKTSGVWYTSGVPCRHIYYPICEIIMPLIVTLESALYLPNALISAR